MRSRILFLSMVCLFAASHAGAQDALPDAELHGYLKNMQSFYADGMADTTVSSGLLHNRLNFKSRLDSHFTFRMEVRTRIFYEEQVKLPGFSDAAGTDNGYFDMTAVWLDEPNVVAASAIDRVSMQYAGNKITVTVGRQRINWGILTVWNPNDIFNAYNYLDFDYEERPGTDAVRIQYQPGVSSVAESVFAPGRSHNEDIAAFLWRFNRMQYDFQLLGGWYRGNPVAGLGWAGSMFDAGWKGEATWLRDSGGYNLAAAVMADYSFQGQWYVSAAALYIRDPSPLSGSTFQALGDITTITRLMPFPWSFYAGMAHSFTPRFSGNAAVIYSPEQEHTILFPSLQYNVLTDLDLDFFGQFFFDSVNGKYGNTGNALFFRLRWSF